MLNHGVDISNWQGGIKPSDLDIDFCICKATEGKTYVDKYYLSTIANCIDAGIPYGFYHFARSNDPEQEAGFFYEVTKGHIGSGIPVLDYEVWGQNSNDVSWCEKFIQKFYDLTGIWCMLYISASNCSMFNNSWISEKCALWVAGYPRAYTDWISSAMPYNIAPWSKCAIWQFTSSLKISGWNGSLDGNLGYLTASEWKILASGNHSTNSGNDGNTPNYNVLADEVIAGKWGNGTERKNRLNAQYGFGTYEKVQKIVNDKLAPNYEKLADQVIKGDWGNYPERKKRLDAKYGSGTYEKVQKIVNQRLK